MQKYDDRNGTARSTSAEHVLTLLTYRLSKMAVDGFVIVQKSLFDCLRQHCDCCPDFAEPLQDLSDGRVVVIPRGRPSGEPSKKRKKLHGSKPQESIQPEPQPPEPQPPEPQLPEPQPPEPQQPEFKGACAKDSRKNEAVDSFLRNAPKATEWRRRQTELELNTAAQYEEIIRAFTGRTNITPKREPYRGNGYSENELVNLAERFALLTRNSLANAKLQKSIATFQALILLSYCEVLRRWGVPYETLDRIIQHIAGRESNRKRLLASALWVNGVIVDLVSHGWTIYRATELFFLGAISKLLPYEADSRLSQTRYPLPTLPISTTMKINNQFSNI